MSVTQANPATVRKAAAFVEALVAIELASGALLFAANRYEHRVEIDGTEFVIGNRDGSDSRTIGIA